MKRLRLDSIALTIGLTIILSMGLGFTLQRLVNVGMGRAGLSSGRNPGRFDLRFYYFVLPARVVSLAEALDASSADQRLGLIAAAQRRLIRVEDSRYPASRGHEFARAAPDDRTSSDPVALANSPSAHHRSQDTGDCSAEGAVIIPPVQELKRGREQNSRLGRAQAWWSRSS